MSVLEFGGGCFYLFSHLYSLFHSSLTFFYSFVFQYSKLRASNFLDDLPSPPHIHFPKPTAIKSLSLKNSAHVLKFNSL